jgi:hypothetical protein
MVTTVEDATLCVSTTNVAVVEPEATVTLPGTGATAGRELVSVTTAPPANAAEASVTVPVETLPAVTVAGAKVTLETAGVVGLTVNVAVFVTPEYTPVSVTGVDEVTLEVDSTNWAEDVPDGTV